MENSSIDSGTRTAAEQIVIEMWVPEYPFMPLFLRRITEQAAQFGRAHPRYRVEVRGHGWTELVGEVHRAAQAGRAPTIAQYFYTAAQEARDAVDPSRRPLFTSVERALGGRREILGEPVVFDDIVPAARDYYRFDGTAAAMPLLTSTTLLYVNLSMLQAAGVPHPPRTWAEVTAACAAVRSMRGDLSPTISWPNHGWFYQQALAQQGALLVDGDNGRSSRARNVLFNSAQLMAYVRWWLDLHRQGHYLYQGPFDWDANFQAFAEQRVAMAMTTSVEADRMIQAGRDGGFTAQACPLPYNGETPYAGSVVGGDALWLAADLDEATRDGALAFMQYLNTPLNAARRHQETGFIPITRSAARVLEREGWFARGEHHRVALQQLDATDGTPAARGALVGDFAAIQDVLVRAMRDVLLDGAAPDKRFAQAADEAQSLLDDYNAYSAGLRLRGEIKVG